MWKILDFRYAPSENSVRPKHLLILISIYCHMNEKSLQNKICCTPPPPPTHTPGVIRQSLDVVFKMLVIVSVLKHVILKIEKCFNILNEEHNFCNYIAKLVEMH